MSARWHAPLDPSCPVVRRYTDTLIDDPMTEAMGAPVDDILSAFERKHRTTCKRCQLYGVANIDIHS